MMRAEWHRRLLAIAYAAVFAAMSRKFEPTYIKMGLEPQWITRIFAIALLIACFKLADKIPDESWPDWQWRRPKFRTRHGVYLIIVAIWIAVILGISGGRVH